MRKAATLGWAKCLAFSASSAALREDGRAAGSGEAVRFASDMIPPNECWLVPAPQIAPAPELILGRQRTRLLSGRRPQDRWVQILCANNLQLSTKVAREIRNTLLQT
ncbi:hypothetical protein MASSI9I_51344 [Massilia sp. 9I]|nr:hypothetical protein MASSI9I_51344 [Massilia sp. 9I]